jgi:hypothetical protein
MRLEGSDGLRGGRSVVSGLVWCSTRACVSSVLTSAYTSARVCLPRVFKRPAKVFK